MRSGGALCVLGVGFGLLIAAMVTLFYPSAPLAIEFGLESVQPFAVGMAVGVLLAGICFCLYRTNDDTTDCGVAGCSSASSCFAWVGFACMAIGTVLFVFQADLQVVIGEISFNGFGVLAGFGAALQLRVWQCRFSGRSSSELFWSMTCALLAAGLVCCIVVLVPFEAGMVLTGLALLATCVLSFLPQLDLPCEVSGCGSFAEEGDAAGQDENSRAKAFSAKTLLLRVWKPFFGAAICAFVVGFTWDTDQMGVALNSGFLLSGERVAGFLLSALLLYVLSRIRSYDAETILVYLLLPLALVTFIVRPYFLESDLPSVVLYLFGLAREMGFALFFAAAWYELCETSGRPGSLSRFLFGAMCLLCSLSLLLGFGGASVFDSGMSMAGAVLFVIYLVLIAIEAAMKALDGHKADADESASVSVDVAEADTKASRDVSARDVETFLSARAEVIGDKYSLTAREREILLYLGRGHSYAAIAEKLYISENTVRTHARNIYRKIGVSSKEDLIDLLHSVD